MLYVTARGQPDQPSAVSARSDILPARHLYALSGDPAVAVSQQARDHRADVVGQAHAAKRRQVGEARVHLGVVAHDAAAEVGLDRAGGPPC